MKKQLRPIKIYDMILDKNYIPRFIVSQKTAPYQILTSADLNVIFYILTEITGLNTLAYEEEYMLFFNQIGEFTGFYKLASGNSKICYITEKMILTALALSGCRSYYTVHSHPYEKSLYPSKIDVGVEKPMKDISELLDVNYLGGCIISRNHWIFINDPETKHEIKTGKSSKNQTWINLPKEVKDEILQG